MPSAFVLINCNLGSEQAIISELKHMSSVKEVHGTFGAYDIVAKIFSEKPESLRQTITWQIRKIDDVRSTLTLMGTKGQN